MRLEKYLTEKRKNNVIVVDVQPMYEKWIKFDMFDFTNFLNSQGSILYFYNGPETVGVDNEDKILYWLWDNGLDEDKSIDITWVDKGYGFFRNWMDSGMDWSDIKKAIRYMLMKKEWDSRDIPAEEWQKIIPEYSEYHEGDNIYMPPEIRIDKLKKWSGSYLVGGGKNECLKEIQILMSAFNIRYKLVRDFVY